MQRQYHKNRLSKNELIGIFRSERQLSLDNHLRSDIIRIDSLYVFMEVLCLSIPIPFSL